MAGSYTGPPSLRLRGRENELRLLADALGEARGRRGACLLLSGGPGRGKTSLLEHTRAMAGDFTVLHAGGVPDESDLPFAGLQRLLRPVESVTDRVDADRRDLLRRTLGGGTVADADRFAFYTGVLELLVLAAEEQPLLLCVDDTDRLDGPSLDSLAFVARRLTGTPVAAVFAAHGGHDKPTGARLPSSVDEPTPDALIPGVAEHIVEPLPERAVHDIITDHAPVTVGSAVRTALVAAAHGNPAAVLGFLRCLTDAQLLGDDPLPETLRLDGRLRADLLTPYLELAEPTRHLLLLAALSREPRAHVILAARAGGQEGVDREAGEAAAAPGTDGNASEGADPTIADLEPAEERGLVRVDGDAVVFTDPLLREAIAQGGSAGRLRAAHRELAAVTDAEHAPVDFALHTASGTGSPDTDLAAAVAEAARHAKRLEGSLAASFTHERAAGLTPESDERACRLASAAYESYVGGRSDRAARLLGRARPLAVTDRRRATVDLIDAQLYMRGGNAIDAADRLLAAGRELVPHDHALALRAFVRAADSASLAGDPVRFGRITDLALPLVKPDSSPSTRLIGAYLEGCAVSFRGDYVHSAPLLRSVNALAAEIDRPSELIWAGVTGLRLGDAPYVRSVTSRAVEVARVRVETANIPAALGFLVFSEFWSGRFPSAAGTALTGLRVARECGQSVWATQHLASLAMIAAIQGDVETCRIRAKAVAAQAGENSLGLASALAAWAQAVLELSRGNAADAFFRLRALAHAGPGHGHPTMRLLTAPHFVEAATRMGETDWAHTSLAGYRRWAEAVDSPGVLALAARCSGLLACGDEAADHFENALALHRACGDDDVEHARTQLLFGAFLRRARLPGRAREHLYNALESFERFGARLWVRQTRAELRAIGTSERGPDPSATSELTAQQQQIARLVAEGATNREVAAHMFISPRTVEHHLRGIFRKLNIRSRVDLARLFN
ncbi:regulatory LuxR family protein [Nocardiopsis sp. Huas11]|uniref:helix-turn-helix transcriptional regulator n=1 Tax=Nocardiopsis sp. Huas11 TaxID=2183912 RepID=UPI000EAFBED4|nr:LuxR family transcriptional regulator [Nocardiopsis sp. Huas11]RKS06949.1 regulatory LuxR family protein [Nocardiopsis sp. Huas11]